MTKTIRIACRGAGTLPLDQFIELQGELKTLLKEDFEKLKKEILTEGFSFTPHIWISPDQKSYLLDGHQRLRVVRYLVEEEGYECPEIPYSLVEAESYQQAKRKLLGAASQYGRMQEQGLLAYTQDMGITPQQMIESYRFADLDLKKYIESNYDASESAGAVKRLVSFEVSEEPSTSTYKEQYGVIVMCDSEPHQRNVFDRLKDDGYEVKVVVT